MKCTTVTKLTIFHQLNMTLICWSCELLPAVLSSGRPWLGQSAAEVHERINRDTHFSLFFLGTSPLLSWSQVLWPVHSWRFKSPAGPPPLTSCRPRGRILAAFSVELSPDRRAILEFGQLPESGETWLINCSFLSTRVLTSPRTLFEADLIRRALMSHKSNRYV